MGVGTAPGGDAVVTGYFRDAAQLRCDTLVSVGMNDLFVARYSAAGQLRWARRQGALPGQWRGIATDGDGNVLVSATSWMTCLRLDVLTARESMTFRGEVLPDRRRLWRIRRGVEQDEGLRSRSTLREVSG